MTRWWVILLLLALCWLVAPGVEASTGSPSTQQMGYVAPSISVPKVTTPTSTTATTVTTVASTPTPPTAAPAAAAPTLSMPTSVTGLQAGDYALTTTVTAPSSTPVPGAVVQLVGGQWPMLRVASFQATPQGTPVTAIVRATGPSDVFQVMTATSTAAGPIGVAPSNYGIVVRGTQFVGLDNSIPTWHGVSSDVRTTVADIIGTRRTTAVNLYRIPISECKWMPWSRSYVPTYRDNMIAMVNAVTSAGMTAIVDLHWACHDNPNFIQNTGDTFAQVAPDQHSIDFWRDAAAAFKDNPAVMYELFNEPQLEISRTYSGKNGAAVWRDGGTVSYGADTWQAPGMQTLYDTVRSTGATNVVLVDGLEWSSDLRQLMNGYVIKGTNVAYAYHAYDHPGQNPGAHSPWLDERVWPSIDPSGRWAYAAMATEFGTAATNLPGLPVATNYFKDTIGWLNSHHQSWAAWGWYTGSDSYALLAQNPSTPNSRGTFVLASF